MSVWCVSRGHSCGSVSYMSWSSIRACVCMMCVRAYSYDAAAILLDLDAWLPTHAQWPIVLVRDFCTTPPWLIYNLFVTHLWLSRGSQHTHNGRHYVYRTRSWRCTTHSWLICDVFVTPVWLGSQHTHNGGSYSFVTHVRLLRDSSVTGAWLICDLFVTGLWLVRDSYTWLICDLFVTHLWPVRDSSVTCSWLLYVLRARVGGRIYIWGGFG